MAEAYDLDNGIYTEEYLAKHPWAVNEAHPAELAANRGLYVSLVEQYKIYEIKENFGLDLIQFLALPMDMIDLLTEFVDQWRIERQGLNNAAGSKTQQEIDKMSEKEMRDFLRGMKL